MEDSNIRKTRISIPVQLVDDGLIKEIIRTPENSNPMIFTFVYPDGKKKTFENISVILSNDGKSLFWFNDDIEGTLVVK